MAINDRRAFMLSSARAIGLASLGSLVWSAYLDEVTYSNLILRPPGALDEKDFLSACIKCGMCVEACPFDTLALAEPTDNKPLGTPFFIPRDNPCRMCDDIPCVPVCPTGALDIKKVSTNNKLDVDKSKMGLAIVDTKNCIAYWGIQCDACYRACPLLDKAITLKYEKNERTGKHAFLKPIVDSDFCTGCGMCERACVTKKPAIFILPIKVATGTVGNHYIKGWDKDDEQRLNNAHAKITTTEISSRKAVDFLNDSEGLFND